MLENKYGEYESIMNVSDKDIEEYYMSIPENIIVNLTGMEYTLNLEKLVRDIYVKFASKDQILANYIEGKLKTIYGLQYDLNLKKE